MTLLNFILSALISASLSAWFITLATKQGWVDTWQSKAPHDLVWKMFDCQYCFSWWTNVLICIIGAVVFCQWMILLCPFVATKITQKLLN